MANPYCQRRNGTYYLRLRVPVDLRPLLGTQMMRSLRTGRSAEARVLAASHVAAAPRWWAMLRTEAMADFLGKPLEQLTVHDLSHENLARMQAEMGSLAEADRTRLFERLNEMMRMTEVVVDWERRDFKAAQFAVELMMHGQNVGLNKALTLAGLGQHLRQSESNSGATPAVKGHQKAKLTLSELSVEFFQSEKQGESSVKSYLSAFQHFVDACGDKAVGRITEDDLIRFRTYCLTLPGRDGREQAARSTVQKHLSHVKNLLSWAAMPEQRYIASNPGTHVRPPKKPKGATEDGVRYAFDEGQLTTIFKCPLYTGHQRTQLKLPGPFLVREDRFFFFLCMFLTGGRNDELPEAGIYDLTDIPCIDLRKTGTKTPAGPRVVPILPELQATGFLTWQGNASHQAVSCSAERTRWRTGTTSPVATCETSVWGTACTRRTVCAIAIVRCCVVRA